MKKKNRKKQLRHQAKVKAFEARVEQIKEERQGKSDYIVEYLDRITQIERSYNKYLDDYVASEIEKQSVSQESYPVFEYIDYFSEVKELGLRLSRKELRVIPDISELKGLITQWKDDLERFLASVPEEYAESDFGDMMREIFIDDISTHFVNNQDNLSGLRNYSPRLKELVIDIREKYISQGSDYVLSSRRNR